MARLQILELPEGASDQRAPFVLVVDEYEPQQYIAGPGLEPQEVNLFEGVAEQIGARGVLVFQETIEIPANDVPVDPDGYPLKVRVEGDFEQFREQVQGEIHMAQGDLARALSDKQQPAAEDGWTGRPTHPDGTPYSYSEITAGGWEPCDGCRTWGRWTIENPHDCPGTYIKGPAAPPAADA